MQGGAAECETMLQVQKRAWGALLQAAAHKSRAILGKSQAHSAGCGMQEQGQRRRACSGKMAHMAGESMCCCTTACITSAVHFSGAVPGSPSACACTHCYTSYIQNAKSSGAQAGRTGTLNS